MSAHARARASPPRHLRVRFWLALVAVGAAAVLLRLLEQGDLLLQQLVLQALVLELELDLALERRLADVALVETALDDHAGRRQGDLPLPVEERLRVVGDLAGLRQEAFCDQFLVDRVERRLPSRGRDRPRTDRRRQERDPREGAAAGERLGDARLRAPLYVEPLLARCEDAVGNDAHAAERRRVVELDIGRRRR